MPKPNRLVLMLSAAAVLLLAGGWVALRLAFPTFVPPPLPQPNGYDDLLRAAEMLAPRTDYYDEMDEEELAKIVEHNRPALEIAREALEMECGVPMDWSGDPAAGGDLAMLDRVQSARTLCRAFHADMREELSRQQSSSAVSSGLAAYRLGKQCYRCGLMVDYLVGLAVQGVTINEFRRIVAQDPAARADILKSLAPLLDSGETADEVIQRELDYIRSSSRGYMGWIVRFNLNQMIKAPVRSARQAALRTSAQQRLFVIHLALLAYHDQHDTWPDKLDNLAPEILTVVPVDPYSESPFIYRIEDDDYRLYSIGNNGRDDGGDGDETGLAPDMTYDLTVEDKTE